MTSSTSLFDSAVSIEALHKACVKISAKNAAGGTDGQSVQVFERDASRIIEELHEALRNGRYVPHPLREPRSQGARKSGERCYRCYLTAW